jgi:capsular polysaccharide biosynthesis protein/Mrp family chromosome partitioning ATPase
VKETGFVTLAKRWWWFLALGAVLSGIVAYAAASRLTPTYEAQVQLLTGPINTDFGTLRAAGELARTYSELSTSRPVIDGTIRSLRLPHNRDELRDSVTATSNEVTRIVTIRVRDEQPGRAAQMANQLARQLSRLSRRTPAQQTEAIDVLMAQIEITTLPSEVQERVRAAARKALGSPLAGQLQVVDPADPPAEPVAPQKTFLALLAAFAGLLLAGVVILLREYPGRAIDSEEALADVARLPVLATINGRSGRGDQALEVESAADSPAADSYRVLAAKMGFTDSERPVRSVLVIGSDGERASGPLAANLAAVLAETARVTLVDANAQGAITSALGLEGRPGYGELFSEDRDGALDGRLAEVLVHRNERFDVVPRGLSAGPGFFDLGRARELLEQLLQSSDFVVLNAPPVDRSPSSLVWGRLVDATVLVVDRRKTPTRAVSEAVQSFSLVGANLVGTVLARQRGPLARAR